VYQDLAVVPLMPVWRDFFLGSELTKGAWPFRSLDTERMRQTTVDELAKTGIELPDVDAPIGSLSGGQRQCVAIARAIYFGARVLILDEPTAALGVKLITHNPHHAFMVGDHLIVLRQGEIELNATRRELTLDDLTHHMAGGAELESLKHELNRLPAPEMGALQEVSPTG
jgi:simple sugar transport system ATP-binding protein